MVEAVDDPREEGMHAKEGTGLTEPVELWISVQQAGADELVEDAHGQRWEDGEEDVVEGKGP